MILNQSIDLYISINGLEFMMQILFVWNPDDYITVNNARLFTGDVGVLPDMTDSGLICDGGKSYISQPLLFENVLLREGILC